MDEFDQSPSGRKYPAIAQSWRRNWEAVIPFFAFPSEVRKISITTNAIESLNAALRKAVRNKGHFPNDQAATKLICLRFVTSLEAGRTLRFHGMLPRRRLRSNAKIALC